MRGGQENIVEILIRRGANVNAIGNEGEVALHFVAPRPWPFAKFFPSDILSTEV